MNTPRPLRLGMVGGGQGAYIGNIHRLAGRLDGAWQLVAGAFDVDPERGRAFALAQGIDASRSYGDFDELIAGEIGREDRVDAVAICTPNFTHYPIANALIEAGFDVICEKPLTATLDDALALEKLGRESGRFVGVTGEVLKLLEIRLGCRPAGEGYRPPRRLPPVAAGSTPWRREYPHRCVPANRCPS